MTLKQKQKLVCLVSKGKNTYGEIRNAMPEIDETELYYAIRPGIEEHQLLEEASPHPPSNHEPYTILPNDRLVLNDRRVRRTAEHVSFDRYACRTVDKYRFLNT